MASPDPLLSARLALLCPSPWKPKSVTSDNPSYHAGAARLEHERYPQNAAHFGSPTRRLRRSPAAILDPNCSGIVHLSRLQTEERHMLTIYDEIQQLRIELAACILSPSEREAAQAELAKLLAEQAVIDRQFDAMMAEKEPPE